MELTPISSTQTDHIGRGYPRPQFRRNTWFSLNGSWEFAFDPDGVWRDAGPRSLEQPIHVPFAPEAPRAASATPASFGVLVPAALRGAAARAGRAAGCSTSARSTTSATVWVNGGYAATRGRLHAVQRRHHRAAATARRTRSSSAPKTIRPISRSRAASRTGSSSRIRSGIRARPASGRPCGWSACRATRIGDARDGRRTSRAGRSASSARVDGRPTRRALARRQAARRRHRCSPRTRYAVVAGEVHRRIALSRSGHRRLPQRAALEPGDADADPGRARAASTSAASVVDSVDELHRAAIVAVEGDRFILNGRPYPLRWCSIRATGRNGLTRRTTPRSDATSSWRRRWASTACASTRRSKTRATCTGPTGSGSRLGGDAERVPLHAAIGRAADARVDRGDSRATAAIRASSRGCRSTSRGACRTCPDNPRERHYVAGALSPDEDARSDAAGRSATTAGRASRPTSSASTTTTHRRSGSRKRYATPTNSCRDILKRERPGGRAARARRAARTPSCRSMLSEFGGIALAHDATDDTWGYSRVANAAASSRERYRALLERRAHRSSCSRASATRSSPTRTRRRTACSTPTARRSSRSRRSPRRPRAAAADARARPRSQRSPSPSAARRR